MSTRFANFFKNGLPEKFTGEPKKIYRWPDDPEVSLVNTDDVFGYWLLDR